MRFLVVGDLHGAMPKLRYTDFDAIIAPGDFCGYDKIRNIIFKEIRRYDKGLEPREWFEAIGKRGARKLINDSLKKGRKVLEFLNAQGVPVYLVPGNVDWTGNSSAWEYDGRNHWKDLKKGLRNIKDCNMRLVDAGEFQIIGYGIHGAPETGKRLKKYDRLDKLFKKARRKRSKPIIYITHNMPYGTKFDKISWKQSPRCGDHVGSLISRELIDKRQPKLAIGGHMHEYHGKLKMGKTTLINAGFGAKANTLVDISKKRIKKIEFKK